MHDPGVVFTGRCCCGLALESKRNVSPSVWIDSTSAKKNGLETMLHKFESLIAQACTLQALYLPSAINRNLGSTMAEFLSLAHGLASLPLLFEDTCGPYRRSQPLPDGKLPLSIKLFTKDIVVHCISLY